jgi:NAD(P)-dependent dehydrogenase (short-subunit alcohol dehydrogenase family)
LTGKVALISGASSGIGLACARALRNLGAEVVITELPGHVDAALHAAESLQGLALEVDLRDPAQATRCVANVIDRFGHLDVLVNNAGVVVRKPALQLTVEDWDAVLDVNLRGAFFLAQAAGKVMTSRRSGRIVSIASIFGLVGGPNRAAYSASKGGLVSLTRSLAVEWAPFNVQVNAVAPNVTPTPMTEKLLSDPNAVDAITTETPAGRLATAEEVGDTVAWLAVSAPAYITGVTLPVDGGWTAK